MAGRSETSIKRAAFINMGSRYGAALLQLVYSIILARILTPEEFGIVAIAQVFVVFFGLFADMGLGSAVVQKQDLSPADVPRLFGFSLLLGVGLAALFSLLGKPIALVYDNDVLLPICLILSSSVLFATWNTIPSALLMKEKRFVLMAVRSIVATLAGSVVGLVAAFLGAGFWAIVIYSVFNSAFLFIWNFASAPIRPIFSGMGQTLAKVFSYSAYLFGFNFINYFSRNLDNLLVGYFFGEGALGNYNKAYQLMQYPQTYLTHVITPVLHPLLAERQDDRDYIYATYVKTVKILSLMGVFITVFCFFSAEEIIRILYGGQWDMAIPCFRLLAVSVWSQMVCGTSGAMFQVLNRTKEHFIRGILVAITIVGAILIGVWMGSVEAVAGCVGVAYWIAFVLLGPFLIKRSFGRPISAFLKIFVPDLVIAAVLVGCYALLSLIPFCHVVLAFAVKLVVGGAVWLAMMVLLKQGHWIAYALPGRIKAKLPARVLR